MSLSVTMTVSCHWCYAIIKDTETANQFLPPSEDALSPTSRNHLNGYSVDSETGSVVYFRINLCFAFDFHRNSPLNACWFVPFSKYPLLPSPNNGSDALMNTKSLNKKWIYIVQRKEECLFLPWTRGVEKDSQAAILTPSCLWYAHLRFNNTAK